MFQHSGFYCRVSWARVPLNPNTLQNNGLLGSCEWFSAILYFLAAQLLKAMQFQVFRLGMQGYGQTRRHWSGDRRLLDNLVCRLSDP